jgi:transcriptional regulator with XRE-family HTH domain
MEDDRTRRVPGLRREEVARLAGVSVHYYTRLEQGRGSGVSREVLDAVATALRLVDEDRDRLFELARPTRPRRRAAPASPLREGVQALVEVLSIPAVVVGRRLDVLASNPIARALLCDFDTLPRDRRNEARWIFVDPIARERYVDWDTVARETIARLREHRDRYPRDRQLSRLIGELTSYSVEFRSMWRGGPSTERPAPYDAVRRYDHPAVGRLTLRHEALLIPDAADQVLHVDIADPGSPAESALLRLAGQAHPARR